jgi:hypothetical protein
VTQPPDGRYSALGQVVETAAMMEISLRMAFCALLGSRYAAVVAGNQETHWLIENCEALARRHQELREGHRNAIRQALRVCREANRDRNRLVHDAWSTGSGGAPATILSAQRSYRITGRPWTEDNLTAVADAIATAQRQLLTAVEEALGAEHLQVAERLLAEDSAAGRN